MGIYLALHWSRAHILVTPHCMQYSSAVLTDHLDKVPAWSPDIPEMRRPDQHLTIVVQSILDLVGVRYCRPSSDTRKYTWTAMVTSWDRVSAEQNCAALQDLGVDQRQIHPAVPEQLPGAQ